MIVAAIAKQQAIDFGDSKKTGKEKRNARNAIRFWDRWYATSDNVAKAFYKVKLYEKASSA
ncbi:hypothetical protein GZ77_06125 [Endozoicomonas montiporae]|uniref:Uncharacterized protein n=3 Tax=Endozoicomonas montiporae TaxID=1027273 RepID=A0A081NC66_9GAMM|nr:hypothetical protein [Endozoicomonas montiporae]AMO56369.1 hypothetical protein EZMO1_2269 [Endozoicomonas montiporae CL-33]KEQ16039.1 hypothetical protein GZ77_06125 [Endozoicomonas montiporae]